MYILGLNAYHADSSAAIFKDGTLMAATEEERFTRVKHWAGFPAGAIRFCLKEAGISLRDVDYITIGRDPHAKFANKVKYVVTHPSVMFGAFSRLRNSRQVATVEDEFMKIDDSIDASLLKKRVRNIEHHRSHLASAF